jgi:hypothetical protein
MNVVIQLFLYDFTKCNNSYEQMRKELRIKEFSLVLLKNCADPDIKTIHILCETQETVNYFSSIVHKYSNKTVFVLVGHQPTYQELMEYIKKTFTTKEIVCLMNADIFFNSSRDHQLIQTYLQKNYLFSLTRHEITDENHNICSLNTCPFTGGGSSDTFIFYTPLPDSLDTSKMDFRQNLFGAEAVFMKPWADAGYTIWNPCGDIITLHLHQDRIHFEKYDTIDNSTNAVYNLKTVLPPIPSHMDT